MKEKYIDKLKRLYPTYTFDESTVTTYRAFVTYFCPKHGERSARLFSMFQGSGCKYCAIENKTFNKKDVRYIIEKGLSIYEGLHTYEKTVYTGALDKMIITCKKHGDFETTSSNYLRGYSGCKGCKKEKYNETIKSRNVSN